MSRGEMLPFGCLEMDCLQSAVQGIVNIGGPLIGSGLTPVIVIAAPISPCVNHITLAGLVSCAPAAVDVLGIQPKDQIGTSDRLYRRSRFRGNEGQAEDHRYGDEASRKAAYAVVFHLDLALGFT